MGTVLEKQHAHELIERMPDAQITTAVRFLEFMLLAALLRGRAPPNYFMASRQVEAGRVQIASDISGVLSEAVTPLQSRTLPCGSLPITRSYGIGLGPPPPASLDYTQLPAGASRARRQT